MTSRSTTITAICTASWTTRVSVMRGRGTSWPVRHRAGRSAGRGLVLDLLRRISARLGAAPGCRRVPRRARVARHPAGNHHQRGARIPVAEDPRAGTGCAARAGDRLGRGGGGEAGRRDLPRGLRGIRSPASRCLLCRRPAAYGRDRGGIRRPPRGLARPSRNGHGCGPRRGGRIRCAGDPLPRPADGAGPPPPGPGLTHLSVTSFPGLRSVTRNGDRE